MDSDQDRDPNSCNRLVLIVFYLCIASILFRYTSPSELMNEFEKSAAECFAQSNDSQCDNLQ